MSATTSHEAASSSSSREERRQRLAKLVAQTAELLPAQGPITAFVFLNTLQALEDLPFDEGLKRGARLFKCQPYLSEDRYREHLERGRIRAEDLYDAISADLNGTAEEWVCGLSPRVLLRKAMLRHPLRYGPPQELTWFVAETDALSRFRPEASPEVRVRMIEDTRRWVMRDLRGGLAMREDRGCEVHARRVLEVMGDMLDRLGTASLERWSDPEWESLSLQTLWRVCREGVRDIPLAEESDPALRPREALLDAAGVDADELVHPLLIRFCAAFTDQGLSNWSLPHREDGFLRAFCSLYSRPLGPPDPWLRELADELRRWQEAGLSPLDCILESLDRFGVSEAEQPDFLASTLLALRGWAGMLWHMEVRPDRVAFPVEPGTLIEFLAVRLLLDRLAAEHLARESLDYVGPLSDLGSALAPRVRHHWISSEEERAFLVFQLAQVLGWTPPQLLNLTHAEWAQLIAEIEGFSGLERRRIFHHAFERRFRTMALDAIHCHHTEPAARVELPRFQAVFCIDTREESFRRHLEEIEPRAETFGAAGFFGVAIYYRGAADAHYSTLCPIVVRPQHWVTEDVVYSLTESHRKRAMTRRAIGTASRQFHMGSRSATGGLVLTATFGILASIPLVFRVLFPRWAARIRRTADTLMEPPAVTRLQLERVAPKPGPEEDQVGFTTEEMAQMGERLLRDIGLTTGFARLVLFLGHGSFCLNNPHKSAYDCGACSGGQGGPNGRALAAFLNQPAVRELLAQRGIAIPKDTWFLGGQHNTCADTITFFDLDLMPRSHHRDFESVQEILQQACERNAHERCRRFYSAPLDQSFAEARRHVEERSEDLSQTRPEFGNASNAMCVVGRRSRTRGLYLDRRSFLVSYDPTLDDAESTILGRILGAVVVVCEGINLQYYFSFVDPPGWACGTKLPHNVTGLLGVMDGQQSDLRPGLPLQGVEIHEPVRCLFVIEATPAALLRVMNRNETVGRILRNGWVQLALLHPETNDVLVYRNGQFEPYQPESSTLPQVATSTDWYRGWRDNLGFAQIIPPSQPAPPAAS
ncbi:MAG: DUF2309 domain-containing protein [Pirellulales bacterium]